MINLMSDKSSANCNSLLQGLESFNLNKVQRCYFSRFDVEQRVNRSMDEVMLSNKHTWRSFIFEQSMKTTEDYRALLD